MSKSEMRERDKVIVTGGASGIGLGISQLLLESGNFVVIVDGNKNKIQSCKKRFSRYKIQLQCYLVDLSLEREIRIFLNKVSKEKGKVSALVNNVGYQENVRFFALGVEQWRRLFRVNVEAAFLLSQNIAQQMVNSKVQGSIVNITSVHSRIIRDIPHYSSSKAALEQLTREMAYSLARYGIRVNAVAPGAINTSMIKRELKSPKRIKEAGERVPLGRLGSPKDVANVVSFLLSEHSKYITGTTIVVDGGLSLVI